MNLYRPGSLRQRIMERAQALPETTPICAKALLDLGSRPALDQALSRLVRDKKLLRVCRGVHMLPEPSPYGPLPPDLGPALRALARLWEETIVLNGGAAANVLGLITQNMIVPTFLTSGPDRRLDIGGTVRLFHAPRWQLLLPDRLSGAVIRALSFLGREAVHESLEQLRPRLSPEDRAELLTARPSLPTWMAEAATKHLAHA